MKRRGRVLFGWFVEYFCFGVYGGLGYRETASGVLLREFFWGGMFWCWVIIGWVGGAGGLPH